MNFMSIGSDDFVGIKFKSCIREVGYIITPTSNTDTYGFSIENLIIQYVFC